MLAFRVIGDGTYPDGVIKMERETGLEPATSTLARLHSTTELLPLSEGICYHTKIPEINLGDDAGVRGAVSGSGA